MRSPRSSGARSKTRETSWRRRRSKPGHVWAAGDPGRQIVDLATDRGASLIVIGGHHEGFFGRTFGLSIQDEVKKHADCDVIVVE